MSDEPNESDDKSAAEPAAVPRPLPPFDQSEVLETPVAQVDKPELNHKAVWSVALGILILLPSVGLGLFAGLVSITSAVHARREIEQSKGAQRGDQLAQIGMSVGALLLIKSALLFLLHSS